MPRRIDKAIARSRDIHDKSLSSNKRECSYARRRRVHARAVNVRNDNHHKASTAMVKSAGRVVQEILNVAEMLRNRCLSRATADASMSGFMTKLKYKRLWYGAEYVSADRWYPSSKLCFGCGWKSKSLILSERQWQRGGCGAVNDRDLNAANNLANWTDLSFPVTVRGDRVRPAMPAVVSEA